MTVTRRKVHEAIWPILARVIDTVRASGFYAMDNTAFDAEHIRFYICERGPRSVLGWAYSRRAIEVWKGILAGAPLVMWWPVVFALLQWTCMHGFDCM